MDIGNHQYRQSPLLGFQYNRTMQPPAAGEFGLIESLRALIELRQTPPAVPGSPHSLLVGIGDDCAVWRCGDTTQLATTDTMVEGVHFQRETTSWRDLGWKALAVNLSDIAAMGGLPDYALVTLGLPPGTNSEGLLELYQGLQDCALEFRVELAGGDVVAAGQLFITVALMGRAGNDSPFPNNVLLRSAAAPGDAIAVTGAVGASAAGLRLLQQDPMASGPTALLDAHRRPQPRLALGRLALSAGVRCGMDVSDGLAGDLQKVCTASGLSAEVHLGDLPVAAIVREQFPEGWAQLGLAGGEDYELLLVAPAEVLAAVAERSGIPLTVIGAMAAGSPGRVTVRDARGDPLELERMGWDHLDGGL
ncbi:MAG: thiamine-phosphate kinase [Dehalococcoidia bacterium]|nr:thiamine-phosphate kinase [Dehalococcoidia bacterium]